MGQWLFICPYPLGPEELWSLLLPEHYLATITQNHVIPVAPGEIPRDCILPFLLVILSAPCHFPFSPEGPDTWLMPPLSPSCHHQGDLQHLCMEDGRSGLVSEVQHFTSHSGPVTSWLYRLEWLCSWNLKLQCHHTWLQPHSLSAPSPVYFQDPWSLYCSPFFRSSSVILSSLLF